jgi:hypothetical protein
VAAHHGWSVGAGTLRTMIHKGTGRVSGSYQSRPAQSKSGAAVHAATGTGSPDTAVPSVASLTELEALPPGATRIQAANAYIAAGEVKVRSARSLRNADLRALAAEVGPARAARACGMVLTTVKGLLRGL